MALYSRILKVPFAEAVERTTESLKAQGFGIITTIDIRDVFKQKLNIDFENYKILGACNPDMAYKAINVESHMGLMLPCNVVVQEHGNGEVEVSSISPLDILYKPLVTPSLTNLATAIDDKLRTAIDNLRKNPEPANHV